MKEPGRTAGKRRLAREMAVQMLFQLDLAESPLDLVVETFDLADFLIERTNGDSPGRIPGEAEAQAALTHARELVRGTHGHLGEIDDLIREQAEHWRLERMPAVDRNVLRLAVFEMLYETDVPKLVVVDEAVELAKKFGSEQSGRFVNGLLDGLLHAHEFPGSLQ
jgi:N utilization substance protein B